MSDSPAPAIPPWADATLAAALFAVDPTGLGGATLRALPGPVRDRWVACLRALLPRSAPLRRLPVHVADGRLLGGLDLAATLRAGRPVAQRGLLAELDGGVALIASAERLAPGTAAHLTAALDSGAVRVERDGLALLHDARFGIIALDEGMAEDERPPAALLDRLAFHLDLADVAARDAGDADASREDVVAARARLPSVRADDEIVTALCATAASFGVGSIRAPLLALRVARAAAALAGRDAVATADAEVAARLVLAPRATMLPAAEMPAGEDETPPPDPGDAPDADADPDLLPENLDDVVLAAARAAIPAGLLAQLRIAEGARSAARSSGRAGAQRLAAKRGRPAGVRRGEPGAGARLNVIETLRAAAPWQAIRRRERGEAGPARIEVRRDDFRVTRFKHRAQTTTIFVVDASGSAAFQRLAEAKGAVELLLADCYVRRDRVALVSFRGRGAELLLPPTRSLVRAKRGLAGLPGGGGTPLAAGIDAAIGLADAIRRRGETPIVVLLTDGRANVARDGAPGRPRAEEEALAAARLLRAAGVTALVVDTSARPRAEAKRVAEAMAAPYLPLPYADAGALVDAVRATPRR